MPMQCRTVLNKLSRLRTHFIYGNVRTTWTYSQTRFHSTKSKTIGLFTLDPNKIPSTNQDPRDISYLSKASYRLLANNGSYRASIRYTTQERSYIPFPENTHGYLYYKQPESGRPDISGSLRFRVVSNSDDSSKSNAFANGADLELPNGGGIWQIHIYSLVRTGVYAGFILKLLEEGLVGASVVAVLRRLPMVLLQGGSQVLYGLEDPFVVRLHGAESLVCMTGEGVEAGTIMKMFFDSRREVKKYPYSGYMLVHFERSTMPEHIYTRTITLRIIQELTDIQCVDNYDSHIAWPTPGELLEGRFGRGKWGEVRQWSYDLDEGKGKAVRMMSLLWPPE